MEVTGMVSEILPGSTPSAHRWSFRPSLCRRTIHLSLPLSRILGCKVYFLPRRAMQPAVAFAELCHASWTRRFLAAARDGGCADANREKGSSLRRWNLWERRKADWRKRVRRRGSYISILRRAQFVSVSRGTRCIKTADRAHAVLDAAAL